MFRYRLVRLYELDAHDYLDMPECLLGFIPLMKNGMELVDQAEQRVYQSSLPRHERADILTGMAILGGLKSSDLPRMLIEKRKDIMIESHAYEIIKNEGIEEGIQQGIQQGVQQGIQQGLRAAIKLGLELRFGAEGLKLYPEIRKIVDTGMLEALSEAIKVAKDLDEFRNLYDTDQS